MDEPASFTDATEAAGVAFDHVAHETEMFPLGGGVVVLDFDGDGLHDIYAVNSVGPNVLYRNNGDSTFTETAAAAGIDDPEGRGNGGCAADYDNDGDQDLFVTNYGPSRLFRNDGGSFADVTVSAGVMDSGDAFRNTGCAWGDYDRDGFVDLVFVRHLYESHRRMFQTREFLDAIARLVLYRNNGDGTFTDTTAILGNVSGPKDPGYGGQAGNIWGAGFQPGWADFDNDGDLDLYVVNDLGTDIQRNVLWRNDGAADGGAWAFTDVSRGSGADASVFGMGIAVGDYDLDGYLDIFVTNIRDNVLLRNEGAGLTFTDQRQGRRRPGRPDRPEGARGVGHLPVRLRQRRRRGPLPGERPSAGRQRHGRSGGESAGAAQRAAAQRGRRHLRRRVDGERQRPIPA